MFSTGALSRLYPEVSRPAVKAVQLSHSSLWLGLLVYLVIGSQKKSQEVCLKNLCLDTKQIGFEKPLILQKLLG